jgi:ketosteroid isomerase-like protein
MTPEEFIDEFVEGWTKPIPEGFVAHFGAMSHPDVEARQPLLPTARGREAYLQSFRNVFAVMPDFHPEVVTSAISGDTVFIASRVTATLGGRKIALDVCDRFELRDGLIYRRQAYFDPTPIVVGVLLRPWLLPRVLRGMRG